ncbi:hypothetical protein ACJX0J_034860 [Zea mays]
MTLHFISLCYFVSYPLGEPQSRAQLRYINNIESHERIAYSSGSDTIGGRAHVRRCIMHVLITHIYIYGIWSLGLSIFTEIAPKFIVKSSSFSDPTISGIKITRLRSCHKTH